MWSIERHAALSEQAQRNLAAAGVDNVTLVVGDGARGLPDEAPFDAINVAAAAGDRDPARARGAARRRAGGSSCRSRAATSASTWSTARRDGLERTGLERVRFVPLVT